MWWGAPAVAVMLAAATTPASPPSRQELVFFNARLALRERHATEVLKLWLVRNSLAQKGERHASEADMRSVVWAALGSLGLCQDGLPKDDRGGAGLWPLALHNWVVHAATKGPPPDVEDPFDAFEIGRQQRLISINDVLSTPELRTVKFHRTACLLHRVESFELGESASPDLSDRLAAGRLMRNLLKLSLHTLIRDKVHNVAAIEARIFDLDLVLSQLQTRLARQQGREAKQRAKVLGVSDEGAQEASLQAATWPEHSKEAAFLRKCLRWSTEEWLTLSPERRLFLFSQARPFAPDRATLDRIVLSIIDALIKRGSSDDVAAWIGNLDAASAPARQNQITVGERGKRLLELDAGTGFRERATIALHRGVAFLEAGQLPDALRSFAYAMAHSEVSAAAPTTLALSRRWLSFVLSRYETNDEVIATLKALVPRQEYNSVIEDLIWRAALRADKASFDRVVKTVHRGGAIDATIASLRLLAHGNVGDLLTQLRAKSVQEPHAALRFVSQFLDKLEAEDVDIRAAHIPTLKLELAFLDSLGQTAKNNSSQSRKAEDLSARATSILEGLGHHDTSALGKARSLSPQTQTFAGNIRLAPADALPWPFPVPLPQAPSAFIPLALVPVEWRSPSGALVFGWKLTE